MGKRFDTIVFPGGVSKAITFSYDDAVVQDRRLVELFNKYGVKGTFNVGSGVLGYKSDPKMPFDISKIEKEEVSTLYKNHEVGGHGLYHSSLVNIGTPLAMYEIIEDKKQLEEWVNKPVKMFAYPFGFYNAEVKEILSLAGYQGARTVNSTHAFTIPDDFLEWNPTCHHNDEKLFDLVEAFYQLPPIKPGLLYIWGHGYEFDRDNNWERMEELLKVVVQHKEDVWFATNGELMTYINAYHRLEYSADGLKIYNPSCVDVYIMTGFNQIEKLEAGKVTVVKDTEL